MPKVRVTFFPDRPLEVDAVEAAYFRTAGLLVNGDETKPDSEANAELIGNEADQRADTDSPESPAI